MRRALERTARVEGGVGEYGVGVMWLRLCGRRLVDMSRNG
jgi:hypothetical protein